ncbi:MAG: ArgE/DapE family deacylase, partial [Rhodospirillales bacterium]|nr:ArgE/DapE family deacylase [Rhodospirillales bacterium]
MDDDFLGSLRDTVRDQRDQTVQFLCDLVGEGSLLGQEQGAQDIMAERFSGMGLEVERFDINLDDIKDLPGFSPPVIDNYTGRENIVGIHRPTGPAAGWSLILNGHIDVVPTGDVHLWTNHPFEATVRDGKVFGRGTADMKAGIVAYCMAFEALQKLGLQPASNVIMQSVVEEECTGNGALACLARGYRADAAVIPEPFHQQLMIAQLGVMWLSVHLTGKPAHVLDTSAGINAIESSYAIFEHLREIEEEWNLPENRHELYCDHAHPVNFNLGKISGGDWASTVPCSTSID